MLQPSCDLIVQSKLAKDINYRLKSINWKYWVNVLITTEGVKVAIDSYLLFLDLGHDFKNLTIVSANFQRPLCHTGMQPVYIGLPALDSIWFIRPLCTIVLWCQLFGITSDCCFGVRGINFGMFWFNLLHRLIAI